MHFRTIAHVSTCYGEKFGVPRQSGLVKEAWGDIIFEPDYRNPDTLRGIQGFSHAWLVFVFHQALKKDWKPTVRPPRLGGNEKIGVFASRSPFRPNPIGLSCVQINGIEHNHPSGPVLKVRGVDLVDGTPLLDIKPYLPYSDHPQGASGSFAHSIPTCLPVTWASQTQEHLGHELIQLIEATLACDPRPAYHQDQYRQYGCTIDNINVRWQVKNETIIVTSCDPL